MYLKSGLIREVTFDGSGLRRGLLQSNNAVVEEAKVIKQWEQISIFKYIEKKLSHMKGAYQMHITFRVTSDPSSLSKGYDPLYSSSPLASLDGFSRSHSDDLYVMQLVVVAATNQNALYKKHMFCRKNVNKIKMRVHIK